MNKRDRNIIIAVFCWTCSAILLIVSLVQVPSFLSERNRMSALKAKLASQIEIETKFKTFRDGFSAEADEVKNDIARREQLISNASFSCLPADKLTQFVDELQKVFSMSGISLEKLAYKTREVKGDFIILPFEANLLCSYKGFRSLLHGLETHPAGIRIEQLEFNQLNFKGLGASLRLTGMVRFKKLGE